MGDDDPLPLLFSKFIYRQNIKKVFIVQSVAEKKEVEFERNDVDCVSTNSETDEVTLNYLKNGKKKILVIGYADYSHESQINQSIEIIKK